MLLELAKLRDKFEIVGDVRGKGLMIGIEMVTDKVGDILYTFWLTVPLQVLLQLKLNVTVWRFYLKY